DRIQTIVRNLRFVIAGGYQHYANVFLTNKFRGDVPQQFPLGSAQRRTAFRELHLAGDVRPDERIDLLLRERYDITLHRGLAHLHGIDVRKAAVACAGEEGQGIAVQGKVRIELGRVDLLAQVSGYRPRLPGVVQPIRHKDVGVAVSLVAVAGEIQASLILGKERGDLEAVRIDGGAE